MTDVVLKGAWSSPAALELHPHALADVARLPVREIISGAHFIADLTLGLGELVFDYLAGRRSRREQLVTALVILFIAAIWAGAQNALAGGGSFITLPSLMLTGMDARAANITSTIALFPAQLVTGFTGRSDAESPPGLSMRVLFVICLIGGALGAADPPVDPAERVRPPRSVAGAVRHCAVRLGQLLSQTPQPGEAHLPPWGAAVVQFFIAIYGGYFGGGIGLLMMASLTMAGLAVRNAGASKNILAGVMNASAVAIFAFSATSTGSRPRSPQSAPLRRLGWRADAENRQREATEARGCSHRRAADDRAVLEGVGRAIWRSSPPSRKRTGLRVEGRQARPVQQNGRKRVIACRTLRHLSRSPGPRLQPLSSRRWKP